MKRRASDVLDCELRIPERDRATGKLLALLVLVLVAIIAYACTKPQASQAVSAGAGAAELVCAVLLDEQNVEHEICDTGAKLAELLGKLLSQNAETSPAPLESAQPVASAAPQGTVAAPASAGPFATRKPPEKRAQPMRLVRLFAQHPAPASSASSPDWINIFDAGSSSSSDAGVEDSPGIVPG